MSDIACSTPPERDSSGVLGVDQCGKTRGRIAARDSGELGGGILRCLDHPHGHRLSSVASAKKLSSTRLGELGDQDASFAADARSACRHNRHEQRPQTVLMG